MFLGSYHLQDGDLGSLRMPRGIHFPGSKMTISGHAEIGRQDVPWTLAAHRFDVLRTSIDPKMVQILTKFFKNHIKKADIYKVLDNHLYTQKA